MQSWDLETEERIRRCSSLLSGAAGLDARPHGVGNARDRVDRTGPGPGAVEYEWFGKSASAVPSRTFTDHTARARGAAARPINSSHTDTIAPHPTGNRRHRPPAQTHTTSGELNGAHTPHAPYRAYTRQISHMPSVTPPDLAWRGEPGGAARGRMRNGDAAFAANDAIRLIGDALREDEDGRTGRAPPGELGRSARHGDADRFGCGTARVARTTSRALRASANSTLIGSSLDDCLRKSRSI